MTVSVFQKNDADTMQTTDLKQKEAEENSQELSSEKVRDKVSRKDWMASRDNSGVISIIIH